MSSRSKYRAKKTELDGYTFDSGREADHYAGLRLLERAGKIKNLRMQVPYTLIPTQRDERGKLVEREVKYIADFVYEEDGRTVVEDTKGFRTKDYILKRKMMLYFHGIRIKEV